MNALEGVIAHELGHITGRHHIKIYDQLKKSRAITLVGVILGGAAAIASCFFSSETGARSLSPSIPQNWAEPEGCGR